MQDTRPQTRWAGCGAFVLVPLRACSVLDVVLDALPSPFEDEDRSLRSLRTITFRTPLLSCDVTPLLSRILNAPILSSCPL